MISFTLAVISLFLIIIIKAQKKGYRKTVFAFLSTALLITLMITWMGPRPLLQRLATLKAIVEEPLTARARVHIWKDTLVIMRDFPLLGTGLSTFSHIYPQYRTLKIPMKFARHPENDYIQLLAEMGLFGLAFIMAFFVFFIKRYIQAVRRIR